MNWRKIEEFPRYSVSDYDNEKCTLHGSDPEHIDWCVLGPCSKETPSNADYIRSMTDEELAGWLHTFTVSDIELWLNWLKQPLEEDTP